MTDKTTQENLESAVQFHQAGDLTRAAALYRQVLARHPRHADALHLLGVATHQKGDHAAAIDLIRRAISLQPGTAEYFLNLGLALAAAGEPNQAVAAYRQAADLQPNRADVWSSLGNAFRAADNPEQALKAGQKAVALRPDMPEAHRNLGATLREMNRLDDGIRCFRQAIALRPAYTDALIDLGEALRAKGRTDEAISCFMAALAVQPNLAAAHNNLGVALTEKGRADEAIASLQKAAALQPDAAHTYFNLGIAFSLKGQLPETIAAYTQALRLQPDFPAASNNLGAVFSRTARTDDAIEVCRQALAFNPNYHHLYITLGNSLTDRGQLPEAIAAYSRAAELDPGNVPAESNRVYTLHFHPDFDAQALFREMRNWNAKYAHPLEQFIKPHHNDPSPNRRLRVGYLSPDFRTHVVGWNLLPLVRQHNHENFETFFYFNMSIGDAITEKLQACADVWRNIATLGDEKVAEMIRQDQIDILVDLTLHMARNRLLVFARKPAPIQVTYLGYCGTTGLDTIDYRFSDPYLDPPGADLSCYSEQTIRLPRTYWCYEPGGTTPDVSPLPALTAGHVTFGSLNNFAKVSTAALDLWAQVLAGVPHSRLILHANPGTYLDDVRRRFLHTGIAADRVEFVAKQPWPDFMRMFHRIDIALDPFPYAGGITTCDGLWMGVPIVTLRGQTAVGRGGYSILSNLGLPDLVASNPAEYVRIAAELANDSSRLTELRRTLRDRMKASPLMDAPQFARDVEAAYRHMWRQWTSAGSLGPPNLSQSPQILP